MTRLAVIVALLTGCAATATDPPASAPGVQRFSNEGTGKPDTAKHRAKRSTGSGASRSLRRPSLENRPTESPSLHLVVTAYCATGSRNAVGNWPSIGTAAANAYPLGTRLAVEGHGVVTVEDRSAPGATDVDLYLGDGPECAAAATNFGRQTLLVRVAA